MTLWQMFAPKQSPGPEERPRPSRDPNAPIRVILTLDALRQFPPEVQREFRRFEEEGWCEIMDPQDASVAIYHAGNFTGYEAPPEAEGE